MTPPKRIQMGIRTTEETAQKLKELADTSSVSVGEALTMLVEKHGQLRDRMVDLHFSEDEWKALTMAAAGHQQTPERYLKDQLFTLAKAELDQAITVLEKDTKKPRKSSSPPPEASAVSEDSSSTFLSQMLGGE